MSIRQIAIGVDQLANTLIGGWADETISAYAWRTQNRNKWLLILIDTLFFWEENHCHEAYKAEKQRRQLPPEYRAISS